MTKRIMFALLVLMGVSGAVLATVGFTAQPAAACNGPHTS